eukprot:2273058-Amphidinium_carterae.1
MNALQAAFLGELARPYECSQLIQASDDMYERCFKYASLAFTCWEHPKELKELPSVSQVSPDPDELDGVAMRRSERSQRSADREVLRHSIGAVRCAFGGVLSTHDRLVSQGALSQPLPKVLSRAVYNLECNWVSRTSQGEPRGTVCNRTLITPKKETCKDDQTSSCSKTCIDTCGKNCEMQTLRVAVWLMSAALQNEKGCDES